LRDLGVPVHELAARRSADVDRLRRLRAALRAFAPHVLHTILWSGNSYGRLAAVGLRIPVIITAERNVIVRPAWQVALERGLDRWTTLSRVNAAATSDALVARQHLPAGKMRVVYNGIDLARLPPFVLDRRPARRAAGFDPERRLVAQIGRLEPQEDYPTFLTAAAGILPECPDLDVLGAGEGALRDELEGLTRRL